MEANTMISYITGSLAASVVALVVSLILCPFSLLAFCAYAGESVTWYLICTAILAAFPVYLVAIGGWERLCDIWERTKYKEGEI